MKDGLVIWVLVACVLLSLGLNAYLVVKQTDQEVSCNSHWVEQINRVCEAENWYMVCGSMEFPSWTVGPVVEGAS